MIKFFKECIHELKVTKYPDKKYMIKYSVTTFATIIAFSSFFFILTVLFTTLNNVIKGLI